MRDAELVYCLQYLLQGAFLVPAHMNYTFRKNWFEGIIRVSDPDPQDPHVFALPGSGSGLGSGSGQKGKEMNE